METRTPTPVEQRETRQPPPPEQRPTSGAVLVGLVLIGAGGVWLLAALGVDVPVAVATPIVLIALGLAVVVSAVRREDHAAIGLAIFLGVWLTIGAVVTTVMDVPLAGAVGERALVPATATELDAEHRLFAGSQTLDLRELALPAVTTEVSLSTVLGEIDVIVPSGMDVRVDAAVAGGSLDLYGDVVEGLALDDVEESGGWSDATGRLDLRLRVGLGEIRVRDG